jgi:exopolysaccharide biosynthesis polyprenyl glycosylphosphotransferase
VTIVTVFLATFALWFDWHRHDTADIPELLPMYLSNAVVFASLWVTATHVQSGYGRGLFGEATTLVKTRAMIVGGVWAGAALAVVSFLLRGTLLSRGTMLVTFGAGVVLLGALRVWFGALDRRFASLGMVTQRVVVIGFDLAARAFAVRVRALRSTVRVVGFLDLRDPPTQRTVLGIPVIGGRSAYARVADERSFDVLVLAAEKWADARWFDTAERAAMLNFCERRGMSLYLVAGSQDVAVDPREVGTFRDLPLLRLEDASLHPGYRVVKRLIDVVGALVLLVGGLPVWLLVVLLVRLSGPGPIFFTQERAGLFGRPFRIVKFRTMVAGAEMQRDRLVDISALPEPVYKLAADPRVTRIGRFLRRTSLDEIPQLVNVLAGQMSLVGPRPEEQSVVALYNEQQRRRLKAKPGIAGLQQVECRGCTSLRRRVQWDLVYLKNQGFLLDVLILVRTVGAVLRGDGAT